MNLSTPDPLAAALRVRGFLLSFFAFSCVRAARGPNRTPESRYAGQDRRYAEQEISVDYDHRHLLSDHLVSYLF